MRTWEFDTISSLLSCMTNSSILPLLSVFRKLELARFISSYGWRMSQLSSLRWCDGGGGGDDRLVAEIFRWEPPAGLTLSSNPRMRSSSSSVIPDCYFKISVPCRWTPLPRTLVCEWGWGYATSPSKLKRSSEVGWLCECFYWETCFWSFAEWLIGEAFEIVSLIVSKLDFCFNCCWLVLRIIGCMLVDSVVSRKLPS